MDAIPATPLVRSFERHLRAANRAPTTVTNYLHAVRQAHRFLHARGVTLEAANRADLEAFMTDLLARREPPTAGDLPQGPQDPVRLAGGGKARSPPT